MSPATGLKVVLASVDGLRMRQLILGIVGVLWGGAILVLGLLSGVSDGAYGGGQIAGLVFGLLLLVAGGRAVMKYRSAKSAATF